MGINLDLSQRRATPETTNTRELRNAQQMEQAERERAAAKRGEKNLTHRTTAEQINDKITNAHERVINSFATRMVGKRRVIR